MRRLRSACLAASLSLAFAAVAAPVVQAQVIDYHRSDTGMNAAMAQARANLPRFDQAFRDRSAERYSVKVAIPASGGGNEHIWMDVTGIDDGEYAGRIANRPVNIPRMKRGDSYRARADRISDWAFVRDGKMHGHYTTRVMLKDLPPEQAENLRSQMAPLP